MKHITQVPLLNRLGDNEHALAKAIESRDADLIYLTIFHLQRHLPFQVSLNSKLCAIPRVHTILSLLSFQDLASMLSNFPQAKALFVAGCKRTDKEMLKSFYYSTGETTRGAEVSDCFPFRFERFKLFFPCRLYCAKLSPLTPLRLTLRVEQTLHNFVSRCGCVFFS